MVERANALHYAKKEVKLSGRGNVRGSCVRGICPGKCPVPGHNHGQLRTLCLKTFLVETFSACIRAAATIHNLLT